MLYTKTFIKTKRETPRGANSTNQALLERGSFIYQVGSGIFSYLPLGYRVYEKVRRIIVEELDKIGCQEVALPTLHPAELWKKSGRFEEIGEELFKINTGKEAEFVLAMTHEEVITPMAKLKIQSAADLPFTLNQISKKIRNEVRPRGGLIRLKEFNMQDAYSFHADQESLDKTFDDFVGAYEKIFQALGLKVISVEADPGMMGGSDSREFTVINSSGEDRVLMCQKCDKTYNAEIASKEKCSCGGELKEEKGIELAHIFKLGSRYSEKFDLNFVDGSGKSKPVLMGCYGIGLDRLIAAVVEESHDEAGIIWPKEIAPFDVYLIDLEGSRGKLIYDKLIKEGVEVLYDDRGVSAGVKFSDADLLGIPYRIVTSVKTKEKIEIKQRNQKETRLVDIDKITTELRQYSKIS
ncbi:hypothetical protein A2V71_02805 [Candidatus Berkelbacteria bacterium RBG_13_40_8]|uniref:Proline--tRNA ligase n=1 Tax=Candidatus Berkelbacteria bacterium RBG_13_40_8 TaxID=1797467 RepID=A0A1F5DMG6_9BACT|nr:MAG: hypothetical protein A2V71_02805 [Candidatus Berkelbacteria bacterium RBG_13_40_8]